MYVELNANAQSKPYSIIIKDEADNWPDRVFQSTKDKQIIYPSHRDSSQINELILKLNNEKRLLENNKPGSKDLSEIESRIKFLKELLAGAKTLDSSSYNRLKSQIYLFKSPSINTFDGNKDTIQRNKRIIVIDKGQIDQLKSLQSLDKFKDLQSLDQLKNLESFGSQQKDRVVYNINTYGKNNDATEFSRLSLRKSFKGESMETTKKFSVLSTYNMVSLRLYGQVKSGVITITLFNPNGNKFKSIEIDATSDVSFDQYFDVKKNPKECIGDWQIKINVDKADGNYMFDITTR
jgi:hypothetical protein